MVYGYRKIPGSNLYMVGNGVISEKEFISFKEKEDIMKRMNEEMRIADNDGWIPCYGRPSNYKELMRREV